MSQYATAVNGEGKAIFSSRLPTTRHRITSDQLDLEFLFISHDSIPAVGTLDNIDRYNADRNTVLTPFDAIPREGFGTAIMTFKGTEPQPLHRAACMDTLYIIEGDFEMELDSGEKKVLHAGDSIIQRACMHTGRNISPNGGVVKLLIHSVPVQRPIRVGDLELDEQF